MPQASGLQWDAQGKPFIIGVTGQKQYLSPMSMVPYTLGPDADPKAKAWMNAQGVSIDSHVDENGQVQIDKVNNNATPSGGLFTNRGEWNPSTGQFEQSTNWNNIMAMAVGGLLTAGVANALMSGAAVSVPAGGTVAEAVPATAAEAASIPASATSGALAGDVSADAGSLVGSAGGAGSAVGGAADAGGAATGVAGAAPTLDAATSAADPIVQGYDTNGSLSATGGTGTTLSKASGLLGSVGQGLGSAANAAASNRSTAADLLLKSNQVAAITNNSNTTGQSAFETELLNRAKEEALQRTDALKNVYRQSYAANRTPGPFNQAGITPPSSTYMSALNSLAAQGGSKLATAPQYDTNGMPVLPQYKPLTPVDPNAVMSKYGQPGTLESTSNWLSPTLTTLGKAYQIYANS